MALYLLVRETKGFETSGNSRAQLIRTPTGHAIVSVLSRFVRKNESAHYIRVSVLSGCPESGNARFFSLSATP